jgi:ABC-type multidrug transport system fused ATPase/permease subunit
MAMHPGQVVVPEAGSRLSFRRTARRMAGLASLARPYRARVVLSLVALLAATATGLAGPYMAKLAIDEGLVVGDRRALVMYTAAFVAVALAAWAAASAQTWLTAWVGQRVLADLRTRLFAHLQTLELGYHEHNRTGRTISRLTNDVDALEQLVTEGLTSSVQSTLTLVGTAGVLLFLDWRLALATLIVFPFMAVATALFRIGSSRAYRIMREKLADVTSTLAEDIAGVRVVQSFRRESTNLTDFAVTNDAYIASNMRTVHLNAAYFPFVELLSGLATAIVLAYGGLLYFDGQIGLGTLFAFALYLANFFEPVQVLSQLYNTFLAATAALDRIFDALDREPAIADRDGAITLGQLHGEIELRDLRFGYGDGPEVLHGVDLHVPAGTTVALVGHTGAGKSTLVKLLPRFYDARAGAVLVDGHDVRDVTLNSLRSQLGIVPQEGFLFAGTIRENIAYGRPDASDDDVRRAAAAVGADGFVDALPLGYDSPVGERGSALSIGQRQLIAFARALLADPRVLILDEATSSVDIATEQAIEDGLERLLAGRTAFVVAHRLSTIRRADLIVVLEHGVVVEQGSHDELIALGGRYGALYGDWAAVA